MKPAVFLDILSVAERLKCNTRHSWTSCGRRESVAEHSWRLTLMALLCGDEFPQLDMDKVLRMCVIHDLGEAFTGDIPSFEKTAEDEEREDELLYSWLDSFPEPQRTDFLQLLKEMQALESKEAKLYKALDNLEAVIQHDEADIGTWLPLEYELQFTYGADKAAHFPWLVCLKEEIDKRTREKIEEKEKTEEEPC